MSRCAWKVLFIIIIIIIIILLLLLRTRARRCCRWHRWAARTRPPPQCPASTSLIWPATPPPRAPWLERSTPWPPQSTHPGGQSRICLCPELYSLVYAQRLQNRSHLFNLILIKIKKKPRWFNFLTSCGICVELDIIHAQKTHKKGQKTKRTLLIPCRKFADRLVLPV